MGIYVAKTLNLGGFDRRFDGGGFCYCLEMQENQFSVSFRDSRSLENAFHLSSSLSGESEVELSEITCVKRLY